MKVKFTHKKVDTGIKTEKSRKIVVLVVAEGEAAVQSATLNAGMQGPELDESASFLSNI